MQLKKETTEGISNTDTLSNLFYSTYHRFALVLQRGLGMEKSVGRGFYLWPFLSLSQCCLEIAGRNRIYPL